MKHTIHSMYEPAGSRFHGIVLTHYGDPHAALMWERNAELIHTRTALYGRKADLWARQFSTDESISIGAWLDNFKKITGEYSVPARAIIAAGRFYMVECGAENCDEWADWLEDNLSLEHYTWWGSWVFFTKQEDAIMFKLQFGEQ